MRRYLESIKSFSVPAICFTVVLLCVKIFELLSSPSLRIGYIAEMICSNLIASLVLSFLVFIIFNIISVFSKKAALYISSILFSIIIISEIGLIFYRDSTGLIMGNELIERPLWETVATVKSTLNFWMIAAALLLVAGFTFVSVKIVNRQRTTDKSIVMMLLGLMIVAIPTLFIIKPTQNEYAVNKIWYCFYSCFLDEDADNADISMSRLNFENEKIERYKAIYPQREIIDNEYPLERTDNTDNVLGEYFRKSDSKPDMVFVVVESLGADLFGINEYGYTFTPFLDSLSKHSLLWTNCLSTTPRSFGVVPAVTGSVPHGPKGFQFGDIPEHNSLFSVLKDNGYETGAFYAGNFSFDKVYDYLVAQKIDYMSPFYREAFRKENKIYDHTYWGYQDMVMFDKSAEIIKQRDRGKSYADLLISISQHDNNLELNDKEESARYYEMVSDIISVLPDEEREKKKDIAGYLAATLYGDDAVKHFIKKYIEYHEEQDYIFVITGDHSLNLNRENPLDAFHVPLIIWSPMLTKSARFEAVVSHNDIAPSLNALLRDNFNLTTPKEIHWVGDELDMSKSFRCDLKTCFLRYTRSIYDGIYENYYYTFEKNNKKAYLIKENLELEEIDNKSLINEIDAKFKSLVYVDNYVYSNNKVTKNPIFPHQSFDTIKEVVLDSIYCGSEPEKPSVRKPKAVKILSTDIESKYDEVKVVMTADVMFTGNVYQDQFINLGINFTHDKNQKITGSDNISKSFVERNYYKNQWLNLEFVKIYSVKDFKDNKLEIYLEPTKKDYMWNPDHSVTLKNVNIMILGSHNDI